MRLILGNLDCEYDFAATAGGGERRRLRPSALEAAAGAATLLRAFARERDVLHLPAPLEASRLADVPGVPRPRLVAGMPASTAGEPILAWAETDAVARLRSPSAARSRPPAAPAGASSSAGDATAVRPPCSAAADLTAPLHELLWRLPPPPASAAARANHRGFALELARRLGCALPGARLVRSPGELERAARGVERWVVKAPFSAAGRERHVHRGGRWPGRIVARLLQRHGELLFEPWMTRVADVGVAALLSSKSLRVVGCHRLRVDRQGRFRGLELPVAGGGLNALPHAERDALESTLDGAARALRRIGYRGAFGLDAWRHEATHGVAFHPLGELNARFTIGLLARALVDRLRQPLALEPGSWLRLAFGRPPPGRALVALLAPGAGGTGAIWLEPTAGLS